MLYVEHEIIKTLGLRTSQKDSKLGYDFEIHHEIIYQPWCNYCFILLFCMFKNKFRILKNHTSKLPSITQNGNDESIKR